MTNYPPGVTGGEDAIAGPAREVTEERSCNAGTLWLPVYQFDRVVAEVSRYADHADRLFAGQTPPPLGPSGALRRFSEELRSARLTQLVECEWSGLVDVAYWRQAGVATWQCPRCGHEHEEQPDDGD